MPHDGKALAWYSTQFLGTFMYQLAVSRLFAKYAKYANKQQKKEREREKKKEREKKGNKSKISTKVVVQTVDDRN